jgi:hypothetical protein
MNPERHTHQTVPNDLSFSALDKMLTPKEKISIDGLDTPIAIQTFLDTLEYSAEAFYRCPLRVLRDRKAHCFDGAMLAAALLWRIGYAPRALEMLPNERDDDHMLALYRIDGYWGAVAKSNFTGLRFREPIFRTLRELVLSYFEQYYNLSGEKTLVGYTVPLDLRRLKFQDWMILDAPMEQIAQALDGLRRFRVIDERMAARLSPVDCRSLDAGLLGANPAGLFQPAGC